MNNRYLAIIIIFSLFIISACSQNIEQPVELKRFQLDHVEEILSKSGIVLDKNISFDGNGAIRIDADQATTIRLFELNDIDIDNSRLIYRARMRSQDLEGQAYLEMYCCFDELGEYFSRDLGTPIMGTCNWVTEETLFNLKKGENPDRVKLNLVIDGRGTVWIDDIRLVKGI